MALEKHELQTIENLYEDLLNNLKKSRDMKLSAVERAQAKEMMVVRQGEIDGFLPEGMTDKEKKSLRDDFQRLMILERDQNADINLSGYPEKIDEIFPGFAAYKKEQFSKVLVERKTSAPVLIKPANVVTAVVDPQDIAEFGKEEAEYLAKMKTDMAYIGKIAEGESFDVDYYLERYRQVLRNGGLVEDVVYKEWDTYLMHTSPVTVSKTMRRDGDAEGKPSVADVMEFLDDAVNQRHARKFGKNEIKALVVLEMIFARESKSDPEKIAILYDKLYHNYKRGKKEKLYSYDEINNEAFAAHPEEDKRRDNIIHEHLSKEETVKDDPLSIPYSALYWALYIDNVLEKLPKFAYDLLSDRGFKNFSKICFRLHLFR